MSKEREVQMLAADGGYDIQKIPEVCPHCRLPVTEVVMTQPATVRRTYDLRAPGWNVLETTKADIDDTATRVECAGCGGLLNKSEGES